MKLLKKDILAETNNLILGRWTTDSKIEFKLLPANRSINNSHSNKLKALIMKHGMISIPIVVSTTCYNKKGQTKPQYFILDGQHRLQACMDLGEPFYFFVLPKENPAEIIELMGEVNNSSLNWGLDGWINAFAHVPAYASDYGRLQQFTREYENFPTSLVANLLHYGSLSNRKTDMIKEGKFKFKFETKTKEALTLLNYAESLFLVNKDASRVSKRIQFRDALLSYVWDNDIKDDIKSFIESIRDHIVNVSEVPVNRSEWTDLIDRIYNNSVVTE